MTAVAAAQTQRLAALSEAVAGRRSAPAGLLEAAQAGDADAFAALVARFQGPTYGLIRRLVRRPSVAEDLAQEVFIRLWRNLGECESVETLPAWLRRVATNLVVDHWRKEDARQRKLAALREHPIARHVVRPSSRLETAEAVDSVRAAIGALEPHLRSVLLLRASEGLSYDEIAEDLGLTVGAVRSRLFRARKELEAELRRGRAAEYLERMASPGADGGEDA